MVASTTGLAASLAILAKGRDAGAWALLVERAGPEMSRLAGRLAGDAALGDDAVHEALLHIRDRAGRFAVRGEDADADAWRWIMRVTANAALQLLRRQRRERDRDRHSHVPPPGSPEAPGTALERDEQAAGIRRELAELPEPMRAAIVLHVMEGMGYDAVAAELRVPVGPAKTRVHRGLETLRQRLAKAGCALSLAALTGALQHLPAASAPLTASAAVAALTPPLTTTTQASTIGAISSGGLAMSVKIAIGIAAALAIIVVPIISSQEGGLIEEVPAPAPAMIGQAALLKALDVPVTFDFHEESLLEVLNSLRMISGVTLELVPASKKIPLITLKVERMRLHEALKKIAQISGTTMTTRKDVVIFGEGEKRIPFIKKIDELITLDFQDTDLADVVDLLNQLGVECSI